MAWGGGYGDTDDVGGWPDAVPELPTPGPEQLREEFEGFYAQYYPRMIRMAWWGIASRVDAEDAVNEAFADAWAKWPRVRRAASPESYLAKIVHNKLHDQMRAAVYRERVAGAAARVADIPIAASAEEAAIAVVAAEDVVRAIGALPLNQRAVLALTADGFGTKEIAEHLGILPETVRSHLRHARRRVLALLATGEDRHDEPELEQTGGHSALQ